MSDEWDAIEGPFEMTLQFVRMEREHTCLRALTWRCTALEAGFDVETMLSRLQRKGYADKSTLPGLRVLEHPDRHTISVVESTQRIQIKIHYTVKAEHRVAHAAALARHLDLALGDG